MIVTFWLPHLVVTDVCSSLPAPLIDSFPHVHIYVLCVSAQETVLGAGSRDVKHCPNTAAPLGLPEAPKAFYSGWRHNTTRHQACLDIGQRFSGRCSRIFYTMSHFPKAIKTMVPLWCPVVTYSSYLPSLVMNQISCLCSLPSSSVFPTGPRLGSQAWHWMRLRSSLTLLISQRSSQQLETTGF